MRFTGRFLKSQQGQTLVEYAYILLCVALVALAAFTMLGYDALYLITRYSP